ncbi:hypothetical protein IEO21_07873 [Rhodonia placenta]|uniref:Uncharacterized protein n=1 Tax=Rhodonia placenta TaxID=104341 RepID=A0A8H7NXJ5_9APHY|nr:hypothetical protein IEO21_07873 [Postia placenta]
MSELDLRSGTCPHTFNFGEHKGPIFPPEISDMFIDALGEDYDHATLAACSLTCHAWVHRSRFHIHSSVRIDSSSNFSRLKELYSPERGLANYVRSLSIDACDMQADGLPAPHPWIAGNIALLKDFTKVKRLALDGLNWNDLTDETKTTILTNYPMVDDLWMSTCDFRHPRHLVTLLQAFPNIKSIRMEALATDTVEWEFMGDNTGSELHLQWLDVGDVCTMPSVVTKWASSYGSLSIENTHISWSHENPTDLSCLLECAGASVKTLSLTLDSRITSHLVGSGSVRNHINLSQNTGIHSLKLHLRLESCDIENLSWISDTLKSVTSRHLSHIAIYMAVLRVDHLIHIEWDSIDTALSSKLLEGLTDVTLCILRPRKPHEGDETSAFPGDWMAAKLPKLMGRRTITVRWHQLSCRRLSLGMTRLEDDLFPIYEPLECKF